MAKRKSKQANSLRGTQLQVDRVQACRRQGEWTMRIPDQQATRIFLQKKRKTTHTRRVSKHCLSLMKDTKVAALVLLHAVHRRQLPQGRRRFHRAARNREDIEAGMQNSFFPHMDSFRRDRSFYMYRVYKKLWGKELELSEPKLNLMWFFLDCVFRYLGNHLFFTDVLLHHEWFVADRSIYARLAAALSAPSKMHSGWLLVPEDRCGQCSQISMDAAEHSASPWM